MTIAAADLLATFLLYLVGYSVGGIIIGYLIYRLIKKHNITTAQWIKAVMLIVGAVAIVATLVLYVL